MNLALGNRLVQNIDLQGDATALHRALASIGRQLKLLVGEGGRLHEILNSAPTSRQQSLNTLSKQISGLIKQAQTFQNILEGTTSKKSKSGGILDEQRLGRQAAAAAKVSKNLDLASHSVDALERRLGLLNRKFAELDRQGRTPTIADLGKKFRIEEALRQVRELDRAFQRLEGRALSTPSRGASTDMARLRAEIEKANAELLKMTTNTRRSNFQPEINQIRSLQEEYRRLIGQQIRSAEIASGRSGKANTEAIRLLNQTPEMRNAELQRRTSQFQYAPGVSTRESAPAAEARLAEATAKRLRLLNMIQAAQDRGAPTRSVERLNNAYKQLNDTMASDLKLLQQINKEIAATPQARGARAREAIREQLFGDGGVGFATRIAGAAVIGTAVFAAINALQSAARFVVDFEKALKQLQAISGSTDRELVGLARNINMVGRESTYSTLEITKAATVIAQAGYSAAETGQVLKAAIQLSTASGSEPSQAVEVLTSALGSFQLQASEAGRVVDVFVTGLNKSKLSMEQLSQAIQYVGATAHEAGITIDELTAIAASLANAGIRSGSTIGTGLRQVLVDMQTPTEKFRKALADVGLTVADVDVKTKGFAEVVKTLNKAGFGAAAAYESFETRAAASFLAFKNQVDVYDELALSIAQGGAAAEAQAKATDNLAAQWQRLLNVLGSVATTLGGPIVDALKLITQTFASIFEALDDLMRNLGLATESFGVFGDVAKNALVLGLLGFAIGGPMGAVIGGILGLLGALNNTSSALDELRTKANESSNALDAQNQTVFSLDEAIERLVDRQDTLKDGSIALQTETTTLGQRFDQLYDYLDTAKTGYNDLLDAMLRYRTEALKQIALQAETTKTDQEILRRGAQGQLESTRGFRNSGSFFGGASLNAELSFQGNNNTPTNSPADRVRLQAQNALGSDDLVTVQRARNAIALANQNGDLKYTLEALDKRLALIRQVADSTAKINLAERQLGIAQAKTSPEATTRSGRLVGLRGTVNQGLASSEGATTKTSLTTARNQADAFILEMKNQLTNLKAGTAEYAVLESDISAAQAERSRITQRLRSLAEDGAKVKPPTARKGLNLNGAEVATEIRRQFKGANVYSTGRRSYKEQVRLYNLYKAGRGALAAKPGRSNHGTGHAIDMTPMRGVTMDNIVAYLEGLGLEVTEAKNELNPATGRYHWHFAWKPKTSSYAKRQEAQQDDAVKELQRLKSLRARNATSASSATLQRIISEARAGTDTSENLVGQMKEGIKTYLTNSLKQFDVEHPREGLSGAALAERDAAKVDLRAKLQEEVDKYYADLYRYIGDNIEKEFDSAVKILNDALEVAEYNAQAPVRNIESRLTRAGSQLNKDRVGAGTNYYLQQQQVNAQLNADRATVSAQSTNNSLVQSQINSFSQQVGQLPEGEDKAAKLEKIRQAQEALNDAMRKTAELQQSINDRTETYIRKPVKERLEDAVAAWANTSGIMQDVTTVLENNVGPALDLITSSLTDMFTKLVTGQASLKSALKGMIVAIGQFVVQLIAKALALMAIKWFLRMMGVELIDTPGGVSIQRAPKGQITGGPAGEPRKFQMGGSTVPKPYISQGVSNRDGVPAYLAQGEYVVRRQAVESLGIPFMDKINQYGADAARRMGTARPVVAGGAKQETNVYVVAPQHRPSLGPNDVLLVIQDDMLQGGTTKQLVKQIAQGA